MHNRRTMNAHFCVRNWSYFLEQMVYIFVLEIFLALLVLGISTTIQNSRINVLSILDFVTN